MSALLLPAVTPATRDAEGDSPLWRRGDPPPPAGARVRASGFDDITALIAALTGAGDRAREVAK